MTNIVINFYCQGFVNVKDYTIFAEIKTNEMQYEYTEQVATKSDFETDGTYFINRNTHFQVDQNVFKIEDSLMFNEGHIDFAVLQEYKEGGRSAKTMIMGAMRIIEVKYSDWLIVKLK